MSELPEDVSYFKLVGDDHMNEEEPTILQLEYEGSSQDHLSVWMRHEDFEQMVGLNLDFYQIQALAEFLNRLLAEVTRDKHAA